MSETAKRTDKEQELWDNLVLNMIQRNVDASRAIAEANQIIEARRQAQ